MARSKRACTTSLLIYWRLRTFGSGQGGGANLNAQPSPSRANIAEGFERLTPGELRSFLVIARGSAGEVRSMVGIIVPSRRSATTRSSPSRDPYHRRKLYTRQLGAWLQTIKLPKATQTISRPALICICHLSSVILDRRVRSQVQHAQQLPILIHPRIRCGQEFIAVEDGIGAGKKSRALGLHGRDGFAQRTCGRGPSAAQSGWPLSI